MNKIVTIEVAGIEMPIVKRGCAPFIGKAYADTGGGL